MCTWGRDIRQGQLAFDLRIALHLRREGVSQPTLIAKEFV